MIMLVIIFLLNSNFSIINIKIYYKLTGYGRMFFCFFKLFSISAHLNYLQYS